MNNLKIEMIPVRNNRNPHVAARFQFYVSLGNGMILQCLHGLIMRDRIMPDRLIVTYPRANNSEGRPLATWMFSNQSQTKFDEAVLAEYRRTERNFEQQTYAQ